MKTRGFKTGVVLLAASLILAGEALAGGGGGNRRGSGGPGPAWQGAAPVNPQEQAPETGRGPGGGAPGPQGRGDGPWANIPPQARGGNYAVCPYCGAPCPRGGFGPGGGIGMGMMPRFQNRGGMPGPGFQGGAWGPWAWPQGRQGFRRGGAMRQPGPMAENWRRGPGAGRGAIDGNVGPMAESRRRGPWQGRDGQGFAPQGWMPQNRGDWRGWQQGGDGGRSGPDALTPPIEENQDDFWAPPRWQHGGPGGGPNMYPPEELDVPAGPEAAAPGQPEAPETNAPGTDAPQP